MVNIINRVSLINSISTCIKLFNALVSSTVLYAVSVCGAGLADDLETVHNSWFRRLLSLQINTPGYFKRKELGIEKMKVKIFKSILNFVQRILEMPEESLPRIAFERLQYLNKHNTLDKRHNSLNCLETTFFERIGRVNDWRNLTVDLLRKNKECYISRFRKKLKEEDRVMCETSTSLVIYQEITQSEK